MSEPSLTSEPGPVVIIGGHEDREGDRAILREIAHRLHGDRILICAAASREPAGYIEMYRAAFADFGVAVSEFAPDRHPPEALAETAGVFFSGGDQNRLLAALTEAGLVEVVHALHRRGGLVAGTSAGASAMSDAMLSRGPSGETPAVDDIELRPGLGLVPGVIIDQHFAERGRIGRLAAAVANRPGSFGLGIDEDTAVVVEGRTYTVVGSGAVYELTLDSRLPAERRFGLRILTAPDRFDAGADG